MKQLRERIIRLLENGEINNREEREKLEYLLKTKKWNPYLYNYNQVETLKISIIVTGIYQFYEVV